MPRGDRIFTVEDGVGHGRKHGEGKPLRIEAFPEGHPIGNANFRNRVWKPAIERAGLPYRKVHQLRSSNISWMLAGNLPLTTVMALVGHEQFATTQRYTTTLGEDVYDDVVAALQSVKTRYRGGQ